MEKLYLTGAKPGTGAPGVTGDNAAIFRGANVEEAERAFKVTLDYWLTRTLS